MRAELDEKMTQHIQNSTLIYENVKKLNTDIDRFSPILPYQENNVDRNEYLEEVIDDENEEDIEIPIWICGEPRYISGINTETTCYDIIRALIDDELNNKNYKDVATISHDISDYVITERWRDVEQILDSDTNILQIWNAWGGMKNEVRFRLKINKYNKEKNSNVATTKIKKHKIEKISLINRLMKKVLKQGEVIQNHLRVMDEKSREKKYKESLRKELKHKYGKKLLVDNHLKQSTPMSLTSASSIKFPSTDNLSACKCCRNKNYYVQKNTFPRNFFKFRSQHKEEPKSIFDDIIIKSDNMQSSDNDDELLLVIENATDSGDSGVQHDGVNKTKINEKKAKIASSSSASTLDICETPRRRLRTRRNLNSLRKNCYTRKNLFPKDSFDNINGFKRTSVSFDLIRLDIVQKMREIKDLLEHEKSLINTLELRCAQYKKENELYNSEFGLDFNIEEIQNNLDMYAKDIVLNEQQLYQAKYEIEQKSLILENLNRILRLENSSHKGDSFSSLKYSEDQTNDIQFTDNIYEFCDNNQSIIV